MVAANIMDTSAARLAGDSTLAEAVGLFAASGVAVVSVVDPGGKVLGVLRAKKILEAALGKGEYASKGIMMEASSMERIRVSGLADEGFKRVPPETPVEAVAAAFLEGDDPVDIVLVVDDGERLLGVITPAEVLKSQWTCMGKKR